MAAKRTKAPVLLEARKMTPEEACASAAHDQFVSLPALTWDARTLAACERLYDRYVQPATGEWIPDSVFYDLPKWVFLEYLVKRRDILAQGLNRSDLTHLEPMLASRNILTWDTPRVYATASGIVAAFFAILDRQRLHALSTFPFASTQYLPQEDVSDNSQERFHFGVDYRALPHAPWRRGTVYLVPKAAFAPDYREIVWFSPQPVRPLARVGVMPWEWPLLDQVRGMDMVANVERTNQAVAGYPWWGDSQVYPTCGKRPLARQLRAYLDTHTPENVSLAHLGALIQQSPFRALRLFRAEVGLSPLQYQTQRRITQAKHLLQRGLPIAQVAAEVGFVDQTHLTRHFKQIVGLTPGHYLRLQESPRHTQ